MYPRIAMSAHVIHKIRRAALHVCLPLLLAAGNTDAAPLGLALALNSADGTISLIGLVG